MLALGALFFSCEDDEDPIVNSSVDLTVNFAAEYDGQDLAIQSGTYDYPTGGELKVQRFQYYVSDLQLLPADGGSPVILSEIELIAYASAVDDNVEERVYTVPAGTYRGIRFGLGVKPELNNQPPSNFSANDPLNENEFWNDRARYVFSKIEANADLSADGRFDTAVTLHMGSNDLYQMVTVENEFTLGADATDAVTVTADILEAMGGQTETYDLSVEANRIVHGGNQATAASILNRMAGRFQLSE